MKAEFKNHASRGASAATLNIDDMFNDAKIYVGTYKKYNEGSIFGKWLSVDDYADKDEFIEACLKLHADEEDPELMFQDWMGIPDNMISECSVSENLWDFCLLFDFDEEQEEAFQIWMEAENIQADREDAKLLIDRFKEVYVGRFEDKEDFARFEIEEFHLIQDDLLREYFDYEKYARFLFQTEYYFDSGFVYHNL